MKKRYLLSPGPTAVPEDVMLAMARPMIHHRTPQFSAIFAEVEEGLKKVFQTKQDVIMLASSGTGAMESAVSNLFSPGEEVLVIDGGKFGERWGKISTRFGLKPTIIKVEWGTAVEVSAVKAELDKNPNIKAVLIQGSETSTTVAHPIKEIAALTKGMAETLLVVDGITAVGVTNMPMDEWGIDVLLTGSQKAFMLPPGLAMIALSDKAWKFCERTKTPGFYFNLQAERKNLKNNTTAYTPAVSLIIGLQKVLEMMLAEGLEKVFADGERFAKATRAGVEALGLKLLAPDAPADSATGFYVPEGVDGGKLVKWLRDDFGVTFAGGQDHLKGKILRVSHMGYVDTVDIIIAMGAIEMGLKKFGYNVEMGKGVAAAQEILLGGY